ncbi:NAD(P)/FAD-dependent oxidoreductase [Rhodococcus opacus]|uniref:NAD(P)/FAD-dependent oxidoreductase n=1 Tax=Rhodococcus opacus TaxID=37919 RepID=UPI0027DFE866|nr:FAD-dependent oxidoreductase [Rhodococcus opacus]
MGAGHGAAWVAGLLRLGHHVGPITVFGDEPHAPYHRPPLSKAFTGGDLEEPVRPVEFYAEQNIDLRLGERIVTVDPAGKSVHTTTGEQVDYDYLVLATGSRPRMLEVPGSELAGIRGLRTIADAQELRTWVSEGRRIAIVGAGYVGLEVAAVVRSNGHRVTVLEREDRVLARVASSEFSRIISNLHTAAGTEILTGTEVVEFLGDAGNALRGLRLSDGRELACDAALVGIGAIPNDELARKAGIDCAPSGGVVVDEHSRSSDPYILAIGDVAVRPVRGTTDLRRLESIPGTTEQAKQATAAILGTKKPNAETPWFWSDQFDLKIKIAGLLGRQTNTVLRGDPQSGKFALFHHDCGELVAVESANTPAEFTAGRKWINSDVRIDPDRLEDPSTALRDVLI